MQAGDMIKISLYTSPHLCDVRERIRINNELLTKQTFGRYLFEVWDKVKAIPDLKLGYFRFLTLLSFYVFLHESVSVAIYETGVGEEDDSTNVIQKLVATGITGFGLDHVRTLGSTIQDIAWHKAGIFKAGCPAFIVPQVDDAMKVLQQRATERGGLLSTISTDPHLLKILPNQATNISLALKLATEFLESKKIPVNRNECLSALEKSNLRGRFQQIQEGTTRWFLDRAHNEESIQLCSEWFVRTMKEL